MHRRAFLASVAGAGGAALAGCSALGGGGGGTQAYRPVARWALAPSDREQSLTDYTVESLDPAAALEARDGLRVESLPATYGESFLWHQLPASDHERVIEVDSEHRMQPNHYRIFEGDFDVETVTDAYEAIPNYDVELVGSHGEFEFYDSGPGFFLHGLADGRAIEIDRLRGSDVDLTEIERVVDAGEGDAETIAAVHDGVATVADRLEPRHFSSLGPEDPDREAEPANGIFRGVTASGASAEVRSEETHVRVLLAFRDEAALDAVDTGPCIEASRDAEGVSELSVETDGRTLTAELTASAGQFFGN